MHRNDLDRRSIRPLLGVALLLLSACGSRLSDERLTAAANATVTVPRSAVGAGSATGGSTSSGTTPGQVGGTAGGGTAGSPTGGAAAGGGSTDTGATGPADGAAAPETCTKELSPIVIASVGEQSGIVGGIVGTGPKAVQAWVAMVNDRGGIKCHPVKYIISDDGGDPSRHQALVRDAVEQQGAIAFVQMDAAITGASSVDYLTQKGIPVIGGEGANQHYYQSPDYFPQSPQGLVLLEGAFAGIGRIATQTGKTHLATISCIEVPICSKVYDVTNTLGPKYGMQPVSAQKVSLAQPDHTSNCQQAKDAGADIVLLALDPNSIQRLARACKSIGFTPQFAVISSTASLDIASDPNLEGLVVPQPVLPWMITSNAANKEFLDAMARYAPSIKPSGSTNVGWVSAKLFEAAAQHVSEPPTSQSILEGLWSLQGNDLGGLTMPLTFTQGQNAPQQGCFWITQISGGQYVSPDGGTRICQ